MKFLTGWLAETNSPQGDLMKEPRMSGFLLGSCSAAVAVGYCFCWLVLLLAGIFLAGVVVF